MEIHAYFDYNSHALVMSTTYLFPLRSFQGIRKRISIVAATANVPPMISKAIPQLSFSNGVSDPLLLSAANGIFFTGVGVIAGGGDDATETVAVVVTEAVTVGLVVGVGEESISVMGD